VELRRAHVTIERHEDNSSDHSTSRHIRELDRMCAENKETAHAARGAQSTPHPPRGQG
jgi:hypothetical protein